MVSLAERFRRKVVVLVYIGLNPIRHTTIRIMAELVDAPDLGSGVLGRESSSLSNPTNILESEIGETGDCLENRSFAQADWGRDLRSPLIYVQISPQV